MADEKQEHCGQDPRTWLLLCLTGIVSIILIHSELGGLCVFLCCILIHLFTGKAVRAFSYLTGYLIFTGIAWAGVKLVENDILFSVSSMLTSIGILGRKAIIPLAFAARLAQEPTGSLMAAFQKLRLPKTMGIATAILLRFFPTISGEYQAIRSSQRFRGIGAGVFRTLIHLPSTVEYILIPLILRTTKVAEELSASMTVRGVRFSGETVSYRAIRFTWRDAICCVLMLLVSGLVFTLERGGFL
ncbi:energy-coupling factor transporter transmembrane protein EcfT [Ruminococcus sp. OA3]|uniref:energy-coupling factor transporter transmembrane component T family protein n=1 Tax=Ruminococcus sp. OA3 TaxID=2914164 RepID=UPI001F05362A|nr:energy-coupling factor transporter transmembrane component T [Ruminococcus sp. OA3]MCH1981692.1 energy-coupling factor transporter transmembrane protein EcfT [Ruminococcus sp. OA3]